LRWSSPPIHADDVTEWQRRTEGQIRDVIRPIEEGRDGAGVGTPLAACPEHSTAPYSRSLRAGLRWWITGAGTATQNREQREKLFLALA
jgi:DNA-binding FrmR family transcriptional regulator